MKNIQRGNRRSVILALLILPQLFILSCEGFVAKEDASSGVAKKTSTREEEIRFSNGEALLEGTLFWPSSKADCPAVVILAGSDRSKRGPLRIKLAKHFAANNIAALVYDSPGTGTSTGNALLQTRDERAIEALRAVDYLRKMPSIQSTSVGLFGGSEGADVALMAAAKAPQVTFVIAVSGPIGGSVLDILRYSAEKMGQKQGLTPDEITKAITFKEIAFVFLSGAEILDWPLIENRTHQWEDDNWVAFIDIAKQQREDLTRQKKQVLLDSLKQVIARFETQRWFRTVELGGALQQAVNNLKVDDFFSLMEGGRYNRDFDRNLFREVSQIKCPVLAIWGQEDSFLPPNQSAMRLKKYLADSNHPDYEIKIFQNASHFLTVPDSDTEFIPGYLDKMTDWLRRRVDLEK